MSPGWAATATSPGVASAYDRGRALDAVRRAASSADIVVVLIHWGVELARCPDSGQVQLAAALHAAGATIIGGTHPHVLQGVEANAQHVTAYSLGNFVWYHNHPPSDSTGVLDVTVDDSGLNTAFYPAEIGSDGTPTLLDGARAQAIRQAILGGACWRG